MTELLTGPDGDTRAAVVKTVQDQPSPKHLISVLTLRKHKTMKTETQVDQNSADAKPHLRAAVEESCSKDIIIVAG